MEAAVGRTSHAHAGVAACLFLLLAVPCQAQDTPIASMEFGLKVADQLQSLQPAPRATAPRLALTLGSPVATPALAGGLQPLDLGVQWQQPMLQDRRVDITAWRRMNSEPDAVTLIRQREPVYGARVEVNLQASKRGLVADRRFIGLQLDSGARITLRRKDGNPVLYYRSQF